MQSDPFLSFRTLVSTAIVKVVYAVGAVIITAGGAMLVLFPVLEYFTAPEYRHVAPELAILYLSGGVFLLTVGNLLWRVLCEAWILLFSVHEMIASIEKRVEIVSEQVRVMAEGGRESP